MEKGNKKLIWFLIFLLSIPAIWALLVPGFYGASDDLHIAWLFEFHKSLLMGKIPPRFVPDLSFNFGYPLFNFVFPLPFYISEIFHLIGFNLVDSIKLLFLLSIPLSGIFMYFLLREFCSRALSLTGAILYIYTPYRSVDIYVRGAIGEVLSFVFLPLIILSVIKLKKEQSLKWVGFGSLAFASLVLSHNITAYMLFPFVALLFFFQIFLPGDKKGFILRSVLTIILSLLISLFFWLPAIMESSLMKYDTVFNFVDHFPTLLQLITPYWGYGASVPGPYDGMSFFLGVVNLLLLLVGLISTIIFWKKLSSEVKALLGWSLGSIFIAVFLMNYRSIFIWNIVPLLPYFQFPWRFLMLTTFLIPILIVSVEKIKINSWLIASILITLNIVTTGLDFRPQDFLGRQDNYYLNRYVPTPLASKEYLQIQEEYLRLPKWSEKRPDQNYPLVIARNATIEKITKLNDLDTTFNIETSNKASVDYNKYFFPGWEVKIDGKQTKIYPGIPFGQISFEVPPGSYKVDVKFKETNFKVALDAISLLAFLVSLSLSKNIWGFLKLFGRKTGLSL